jgi:4-alpha-glucanotransferase
MPFERAAGILLHPTSLPGFGGIGSLGAEAYQFVDTLQSAGMRLWQVLPLGPTGYGDAPYSALSAFAGNPLLIALQPLVDDGLLTPEELTPLSTLPDSYVDFGRVVPDKMAVLRRSFDRFPGTEAQAADLQYFRTANAGWVEDVALFMAIKHAHGGGPWKDWEPELRSRQPDALALARHHLAREIDFHVYIQWQFFRQWEALKRYANGRGIRIVGDIPIFVALDSSDVWAHQDVFQLDPTGTPSVVAGVPPDYFSATGQLWGNPHYRWDRLEADGFSWWIDRFRMIFRLVDIVRLDHFRGFAAAWQVPHGEDTAIRGEWVPAPGEALFQRINDVFGGAPIIAEDLGVITPDVEALRDRFHFPGMQILQFAFSSTPRDPSLPHNYRKNTVVYTGTHDNDTTVGWFAARTNEERGAVLAYVGTKGLDIAWDLIRLAFASTADLAIVPLQDVLRLGTHARMNYPGRPEGNWSWRFTPSSITADHVHELHFLAGIYGRVPDAGWEELTRHST